MTENEVQQIWNTFDSGQAWAHQEDGSLHVILILRKDDDDLRYYEYSGVTKVWVGSRASRLFWEPLLAIGNYKQIDPIQLLAKLET